MIYNFIAYNPENKRWKTEQIALPSYILFLVSTSVQHAQNSDLEM